MKKRTKNFIPGMTAGLIAVLILFAAIGTGDVHAISSSGSISVVEPKGVYDIGEELTLQISITSDKPFDVEGTVTVSGGLQLIATNGVSNFNPSNGIFWEMGKSGTWRFLVRVRVLNAGSKSVSFSATCSSKDVSELTATSSASGRVEFYVRTEAERQQAIAAYEAEQQRIREEAARQAAIQASIAESRAIEVSIAASIEASIKESEYAEASLQQSIEESVAASESEEELTRPSEIGEVTYARFLVAGSTAEAPKYMYLLLKDHTVRRPEGFEDAELSVNHNGVLALKEAGMARDVYLVYGMLGDKGTLQYYFLNTETGEYFPYAYLDERFSDDGPDESESGSKSETESETEAPASTTVPVTERPTDAEPDDAPSRDLLLKIIQIAVFAFLLGIAIAALIAVLVKGKKKQESTPEEASSVNPKPRAKKPVSDKSIRKTSMEAAPQKTSEPVPVMPPLKPVQAAPEAEAEVDPIDFEEIDDWNHQPADRHEIDDGE